MHSSISAPNSESNYFRLCILMTFSKCFFFQLFINCICFDENKKIAKATLKRNESNSANIWFHAIENQFSRKLEQKTIVIFQF